MTRNSKDYSEASIEAEEIHRTGLKSLKDEMHDPSKQSTSEEFDSEVIQMTVLASQQSLNNEVSSRVYIEENESKSKKIKNTIKKYLKFVGPGLLVSVAYIDPGNYSTAVTSGAQNQYTLLCVVLLSNCIAIYLQCLCIKLASVTGLDLARACRTHLPRWANIILYCFGEACIISTDIAEVIGTAIALNILIKVPLPAGVAISIVDIFIIMLVYRPGVSSMKLVRMFEIGIAGLVLAVFICFTVELSYIPFTVEQTRKIFRGFVPSREMFHNSGMYNAISILGATVMPHSLFLGSGIVQPRLLDYDLKHNNYSINTDPDFEDTEEDHTKYNKEAMKEEKFLNYAPSIGAIKYCMKYSMIELGSTLLTVAFFINCAILIVAGSTLYGTDQAIGADLYTIHSLLSSTISKGAGTIFMLALLLSGQSAGIVCTMAGQIVCEGHIKWSVVPWKRRLLTRGISIIPCLIISICIGRSALSKALNSSQVVLSLLLPFIVAPLVYFTSSKKIMSLKVPVMNKRNEETSKSCADAGKQNDLTDPSFQEARNDGTDIDCSVRSENITPNNSDVQGEEDNEYTMVDMSNNWAMTIVSGIVWIFLSLLNVYAIVELGISHGDIS
ncbi:hypothetical protein TPHA_0F03380 [Tetrapisispora phaffii CBS 4417]|uniref:Uncharacterized protein n=1 Tax=Tetrapisispora phaffii (strain ATCC 24235 / CBS 4417 / NBRC 1672 / NRRL Y-8282 / UCD 70-5) TaxID=1071381 RepID=G8BUN3_TETPH|nr:hypothetical protein TPHA_0F03380 [Tetrapisispora phaffii CBS 4417]CCE63819.1 hypothetical protein TPHA_0F03380 [Tetrapisispora phaffii CBS 4417]